MQTPAPFDIDSCLAQVRAGDEEAARQLVAQLHPLVMTIVRANPSGRQAEEDLAQEVYGRVFERLDHYRPRPGIPFEHWVARLAVRVCLDIRRAERRRPEVRQTDLSEAEFAWLEFLVAAEPASAPGEAASARGLLDRLLAELAPADRLVISLLDLEEKSISEVSALTGWSSVLVRVRAFRARGRLRRLAQQLSLQEGIGIP